MRFRLATKDIRWQALVVVGAVICPGCSDKEAELAPVSGVVLLDDKPLSTGAVVTVTDDGRGARGTINSDGTFTLETRGVGPGARPGTHHVSVVAYAPSESGGAEGRGKSLIPTRYTNPYNSGLTLEVEAGGRDDVKIQLSSNPRRN